MGYFADLGEHKASFLKGFTFVLGGFALMLAGTIVGYLDSKLGDIAAGTLATTGVVIAFLGFFIHVIPPLLPAK